MVTTGPINNDNSTSAVTVESAHCKKTKAKDLVQLGVATIDKSSSVYQAVALMAKKKVTSLPVVDESGLAGIISEKDVLKLLYETEFVEGCVGDYMTKNVLTFDGEDDLADICWCLIGKNFRSVPILHQGRLAGIISRADLIKAGKDKFRPDTPCDNSILSPADATAKDVMICGLLTVRTSTPVYEAMEILSSWNITGLPVVDDFLNLLGIISEKDVLKLLYNPKAKPGMVKDYMTTNVVSFEQSAPLFEICDCLIENNFRRVTILDGGKLVGIISRTDIMAYIMKNRSRFFSEKIRS